MDETLFKQVAAHLHGGSWIYYPEKKCGYNSTRYFDYGTYSLSWMTPSEETITADWKTDCCGWHDEWVIDWEDDELEGMMKRIAENHGEVTFFRRDSMVGGAVCVDYNIRDIYIEESSSYNAVDFFIVTPDGITYVES